MIIFMIYSGQFQQSFGYRTFWMWYRLGFVRMLLCCLIASHSWHSDRWWENSRIIRKTSLDSTIWHSVDGQNCSQDSHKIPFAKVSRFKKNFKIAKAFLTFLKIILLNLFPTPCIHQMGKYYVSYRIRRL